MGVMGVDVDQLKAAKQDILELLEEKKCGPLLIRLAWHDSGTFDTSGKEWPFCAGSNGSLRFPKECKHACNGGLDMAVNWLKPIKDKHPNVSWADLMQLASATSVESGGGPKIDMLYGRKDVSSEDECAIDGVLPAGAAPWPNEAAGPAPHLRWVFYRQGFNDQEIVALSGAHTMGRAHASRSGLGKAEGTKYTAEQLPKGVLTKGGSSWTKDWLKFDNSYFTEPQARGWHVRGMIGHIVYCCKVRDRKDPDLLALDTDTVLFEDPGFKPYAEKYAEDEEAFFKDYAAAHKKLSENGAKWVEGGPVSLD